MWPLQERIKNHQQALPFIRKVPSKAFGSMKALNVPTKPWRNVILNGKIQSRNGHGSSFKHLKETRQMCDSRLGIWWSAFCFVNLSRYAAFEKPKGVHIAAFEKPKGVRSHHKFGIVCKRSSVLRPQGNPENLNKLWYWFLSHALILSARSSHTSQKVKKILVKTVRRTQNTQHSTFMMQRLK